MNTEADNIINELEELLREREAHAAKDDFYAYCQYREGDFYKDDRPHLKRLCDTLNAFYFNDLLKPDGTPFEKLMIRWPPQHGKSRTLFNFSAWCLGKNQNERLITGSYGDSQASDFSRFTRDSIMEPKNTPDQRVFSDVFPKVSIKQGNASFHKWALEGQHFNYLGVGVGGAVTGKGATIRIVDDLIKDIEAALSPTQLEKAWNWFSGTFTSRNSAEEGNVKEIFCGTLWGEQDPQAILEKLESKDWFIFKEEVYNRDTNEMLCDDFLNKSAYEGIKTRMMLSPATEMIFWANYHSEIVETANLLYGEFQTYNEMPTSTIKKGNYTDTADMGDDPLCSICYEVSTDDKIYVTDVIYTSEPMEATEEYVPMMLERNDTRICYVESNNGGRGFARVIERKAKGTSVTWFHQSANKESRIKTNSPTVMQKIVFPADWKIRWPEFARAITLFKKVFKSNKHDDAPDCLTGIVEKEMYGQSEVLLDVKYY